MLVRSAHKNMWWQLFDDFISLSTCSHILPVSFIIGCVILWWFRIMSKRNQSFLTLKEKWGLRKKEDPNGKKLRICLVGAKSRMEENEYDKKKVFRLYFSKNIIIFHYPCITPIIHSLNYVAWLDSGNQNSAHAANTKVSLKICKHTPSRVSL